MAKGRAMPCAGGKFLRELAELVGGLDGDLVGEDVVAIVVAKFLALGVKEAGVDGGLEAPVMEGEREVVTDPGDVIFFGGLFEQRVGGGAVGALEVFKFDDGDFGAGGRLEGSGVMDRGGFWRAELGMRSEGEEERCRG